MPAQESRVVTVLVLLPVYYNPDAGGRRKPVEDEKFVTTGEEISERFGGATLFRFRGSEAPHGFWWDRGHVERDTLALLEVDIPDTSDDRAWVTTYARDTLRSRFDQKAIYVKFIGPVQRLVVTEEVIGDD